MSIKFAIKNTASKAEKEGDTFVRYSGTSEPFNRVSAREGHAVGLDGKGDPKIAYITGLDEKKVQFFKWYSPDEQKSVSSQIEEMRPMIEEYYGGKDIVNENNAFFWGNNRDVSRLSLANEDIDVFYDTKNPVHALLYLSIISGAFIDTVAPTKDWAERHQIPHFMVLETEDNYEDDDHITKSEAHAALSEIRKDESGDALFILAWCLQYDTKTYGAYLRNTPARDLINYHIKYIEGNLQLKRKRNTPKQFIEYAEKWKGQQTREALYIEAYVKAGEYYNFVNNKEKRYTTVEGVGLGNSIEEAVNFLKKAKNADTLDNLRERVEAKWRE